MMKSIALCMLLATSALGADRPMTAKSFSVDGGEMTVAGETVRLRGNPGQSTTAVLKPENGDFSAYQAITFALRNPSDKPITVRARAENPDAQRLMNASQNAVELLPGESQNLVLRLTPRPADPTYTPFKNFYMYYENLNVRDNTLDPARISRIVISVDQWKPGQSLEINSIAATGTGKPLPVPYFPFVDQYGQYVHGDWPGKIYQDSDFAQRLKEEERERAASPGPDDRDDFGGWAKGPKLKATGFFYPARHQGKWWLVDPRGFLFWSNGPTGVGPGGDITPTTDREQWFVSLPDSTGPLAQFYHSGHGAMFMYYRDRDWRGLDIQTLNNYRKYGENYRDRVAETSNARLRSWGFNTIGNWSDSKVWLMHKTPYTVPIHGPTSRAMRGDDGHSFQDVFDPDWEPGLYALLEKERNRTANDPWCIGYFVDNERAIGWRERGAAIGEMALKSPPAQPAKVKFIAQLKGKYPAIETLNQSWGSSYASWDALLDSRRPPAFKDNKAFTTDCGDFGMAFLERYFSVARSAVKRVAPNNLFLGSRLYGHCDPAVVALAGKYWDVISYNIYDNTPTSRVNQYAKLDLPIMSTEWGVESDVLQTPFRDAKLSAPTPKERGDAIARYLDAAIRHPNIIGAHFFQFRDQPLSGRPDGEATLRGLVNVADTPNFEMIQVTRRIGYEMYKTRSEAK